MIKDFENGTVVSFKALCCGKEEKLTKAGSPYLDLVLSDSTGTIPAKVWTPEYANGVEVGKVVGVNCAKVDIYNEVLQITITSRVTIVDESALMYCRSSKYGVESMWGALQKLLACVENEWCKKLIDVFISDASFKEKFCSHSAAVSVHGDYVGGLLEHTLAVTRMSSMSANVYQWLNKDLMITSAFLHDIGKLKELSAFPENQYTDYGQYVGHVVGSAMMVEKACDSLEDFPEDVKFKVIHCILAHHGKLEWGSPKVPAIPEAFAICTMDNLDAKLKIFEKEAVSGKWSGFSRYLETKVRLGDFETKS